MLIMDRRIKQIIDEYAAMKETHGRFSDAVVETAMFIEDTFGIRLTDEEINAEFLGTDTSVVNLVKAKLGAS